MSANSDVVIPLPFINPFRGYFSIVCVLYIVVFRGKIGLWRKRQNGFVLNSWQEVDKNGSVTRTRVCPSAVHVSSVKLLNRIE